MGREVRMIKAGWEHPQDGTYDGKIRYIPLFDNYAGAKADYDKQKLHWDAGFVLFGNGTFEPKDDTIAEKSFEQYWCGRYGREPNPADYMPQWAEGEATKLVMYENCTEGTPVSPPFDTPEELARWLADNNASAFGRQTANYEDWLATIECGWSVSAVIVDGEVISGVKLAR